MPNTMPDNQLNANLSDFLLKNVRLETGFLYDDMDINFIGGLDPTVVDGDAKKSLDIMFDIALDYDKGVDIHLHESLPSGKAHDPAR